MFENGTWRPYTGSGALLLAGVLLVICGILVFLGSRLRRPLWVQRPGKAVSGLLVLLWVLSLATLAIAVSTYVQAFFERWGTVTLPPNRVSRITDAAVLATFISIAWITRRHGWKTALGSAFVGAAAAPMIFELPFDLIVMFRTFPPEPATRFTLLYFLPLFMVEISTFSLLTLSPVPRISKYTVFALAAMFFVFAHWALVGFAYPLQPAPFALNVISKIISFIVAITLFLEDRGRSAPG